MPDYYERLTVTKVALPVSPFYQKEACTTLKTIVFKMKLNTVTMKKRKGSIIANAIHQKKSLTFEVCHHTAAQVDNRMINTEIKESAEH